MAFFKHLKNGLAEDSPAPEAEHEEAADKQEPESPPAAEGDEAEQGPGVGHTPVSG